jgi:Protein of unknown function (DUF3035)
MNRKILATLATSAMLLSLSGCGTTGLFGGKGNAVPVSRAAPLVVPPDYALAPIASATPRAEGNTQDQVIESLFGGAAPRSASEAAIVKSAGNADLGIRSTVGDPDTVTINKGSVTRDIIAAPEGDGQAAQAVIPE